VSLSAALAALPMVTVVTIGRRSGLPRQHHLLAIPHRDDLALIGTNSGQLGMPAWALNLNANPGAGVSYNGITRNVSARPASAG
jgi:deazaflavin-dependent oxidoreductase (nitroreductase family)